MKVIQREDERKKCQKKRQNKVKKHVRLVFPLIRIFTQFSLCSYSTNVYANSAVVVDDDDDAVFLIATFEYIIFLRKLNATFCRNQF